MAVGGGPVVELGYTLEMADESVIDGREVAGMGDADVAFAELGAESFEQPDPLAAELDQTLTRGLFKPQRALRLGQRLVMGTLAAQPSGGDLHALERQLRGEPQGAVSGMIKGMSEDGVPDLFRDPAGMGSLGSGRPVDGSLRLVILVVAPDLVELLV